MFKPGDKVEFNYEDAVGAKLRLEGTIDSKVTTETLDGSHHWIDIGNIRLLIPTGDIRHDKASDEGKGENPKDDARIQARDAALGQQGRPEGDEPKTGKGNRA